MSETVDWREPSIFINNVNSREALKKWKTTEEAAMAAEQKAVESMAQETMVQAQAREHSDHADHVLKTVKEGHSEKTLREEPSVVTDHADHSLTITEKEEASEEKEEALEKILREEVSVETDHADHSLTTTEREEASEEKEEALEKTLREEASVVTDHADHSLTTTEREEASAAVREDHSEIVQKEGASEDHLQADSETLEERALTRKNSTTSVTRRRAE